MPILKEGLAMFCANCGKPVDEGVAFCPECGAMVSEPQKEGSVAIQTKGEKAMEQKKGFFASLFDFSFSEFITTRIIKVLYGLGIMGAILLSGLVFITPLIKGYSSTGGKLWAIILFPLLALLYIIIIRVIYEVIIVIFRIAEYSRDIRDMARRAQGKS